MSTSATTDDAFSDEVRGVLDRLSTSRTEVPIVHGRNRYSSNVQQHIQLVVDDAELVHYLGEGITHGTLRS